MKYVWILVFFVGLRAGAEPAIYQIKRAEAESKAFQVSNRLKSYSADEQAATSGADAQLANLYPKLSFLANYQYYAKVPEVAIFGGPPFPFGTHSTYSIGPALNYTLWDTFATRKAYRASTLLAQARSEDRKNAESQLLFSVRTAYVQVQLGLEELEAINESLNLSKAQARDVNTRFSAGSAAQLDVVEANRSVLGFRIQFEQRQAELSSEFQDLLALLRDQKPADISHPGPEGIKEVSLVLKLDSLDDSLKQETQKDIGAPEQHPQIKSLALQAESAELSADSQSAKLYPAIQINGGVAYNRLNMPNPPDFLQETVGVSLSLPLYIGDPTPSLAAQSRSQALATGFRKEQLKEDIQRDFSKAETELESLRERRKLATQDVEQSEHAAKLYYRAYRAGKVNLIDVQNANTQALQAKVNAARIDAQTLLQINLLKSLSGKENPRG